MKLFLTRLRSLFIGLVYIKRFTIIFCIETSTGYDRMDSHISKGNKKQTKQVIEKSFIFSKSTYNLVFSPLGFENNITQVAAVIRDALPKPFSKVFHHYVGHLWGNGGNFLTNSVLKCFEGLRPMCINLGLEVSPQEKIAGGQIGRACGLPDIA